MARPIITRPNKKDLQKFYQKELRSVRDIAELLGCSKDLIFSALKEYGIERRRKTERRSQLMNYDFVLLKKEVKKKGYSQVARELGINKSTLTRYFKKRLSLG